MAREINPPSSWAVARFEFAEELLKSMTASANPPKSPDVAKEIVALYLDDLADLAPSDAIAAVRQIRLGEWEFGQSSRWLRAPISGRFAPSIAEIRHVAGILAEIRAGKRASLPTARL